MRTWVKLLLVFALAGAVIAGLFWMEERRRGTMTAEAPGVVTEAVLERDDESSSLDQTIVSYRFQAGGTEAQGSSSFPGDKVDEWPEGRSVRICYNPQEPAVSEIRASTSSCG